MRTGTGVVEEVCPNGLVKIQTNRNNLYSPCSDSMCADNVVIDAVNPIGAQKGQYVQFNIPDAGMGVKVSSASACRCCWSSSAASSATCWVVRGR